MDEIFNRVMSEAAKEVVDRGTHQLYGSTVREIATGKIFAFLQETSATSHIRTALSASGGTAGTSSLAEMALRFSPLRSAGLAVDAAGDIATYHQNEQIKAALCTVQQLQLGNLLLSGTGIGVSVAGLAIVKAQLGRIERAVDGVMDKLDHIARSIDLMRREIIAGELADLAAAAEQYEEGWLSGDGTPHWRAVARNAHKLARRFEQRTADLLHRGPSTVIAAIPMFEAFAFASSLRMRGWIAAEEDTVARNAASTDAEALGRLGDLFDIAQLALAHVGSEVIATKSSGDQIEKAFAAARSQIAGARAQEAAAVSTALVLEELASQEISGRAWLAAARAENEAPLIFLPTRLTAAE